MTPEEFWGVFFRAEHLAEMRTPGDTFSDDYYTELVGALVELVGPMPEGDLSHRIRVIDGGEP